MQASMQTCKTCGGDLHRIGNHYVCQACGNRWSVDAADDVRVVDRANAWSALRDGDFDHAAELFEIIHEKDPKDHEAFWGLALACAGILYVVDYDEHKKVPTCNNIDETSFLNSKNVKKAIELAPTEISNGYRQQAEQIERIRQEWLQKARKEKPYDVFISYKDSDRENGIDRTRDSIDAQDLYQLLVDEGYRVFFSRISLRDKISEHYEPYIYNAIKTAKVMIVFGEKPEYFTATWVRNEWSRFKRRIDNGEKHKNSLVVVTKNMNPGDLPVSLRSRQSLTYDTPADGLALVRHVKTIVDEIKNSSKLEKKKVAGGIRAVTADAIAQNTITKRDLSQQSATTSIGEKQSLMLVETYIKEKQWEEAESLLNSVLFQNPSFAEALWCQLLIRHKVVSNTILMRIIDRFKPDDYALVEKVLNCASKEFAGHVLDLFYQSGKLLPNQVREKVYNMILPYRYERRDQQLKENFEWSISNHDFKFFNLLLTALEQNDVDQYIKYNEQYLNATMDHQEKRTCTDNILTVSEGNRVARMYIFESALTTATKLEPVVKAFEDVLKYSENIDADVEDALVLTSAVLNTPLHCEFAQQLPGYFTGDDLKTLRRALLAMANRMLEKSFFEPAQFFFNLLISINDSDIEAFWGICLARTHSTKEDLIINSPILLKNQAEYNKYLTLVDDNRRVECVRLAKRQQTVQRSRRRKRIRIVIGTSVAAVLVAGSVVTVTVILPGRQFKKANDLFISGNYAAAGELYQKLGDYDDSSKYAETVKAILQVEASNHEQAVNTLLAQGIPVEITYKAEGGFLDGSEALVLGHTLSMGSIIPLASEEIENGVSELTRVLNKKEDFNGLLTPSMPGYQFAGWETESFSYDITEKNPVFHMALKATWNIREYAINYDLDGGYLLNQASPVPAQYTIQDAPIQLPQAAKDGFVFKGWSCDGSSEIVKDVTIPTGSYGNKTFKAEWDAVKYTITLDYACAQDSSEYPESMEILSGSSLELPNPTRNGYQFNGWWENDERVSNGIWTRAENVHFKAKWKIIQYEILYHLNGGRNNNANPEQYTVETDTFSLNAPVREGYTFLGWSTSGDGANPTKEITISKELTGDLEFFAVWKVNEATVKLDANHGSCSTKELHVTYGKQFQLPTPTREGHAFVGWELNGTLITSGICKITEDCTLVAKWKADAYTIRYNLDGGVNHELNPDMYTVVDKITLSAPMKTGHEFLGWTYDGQTTPVKNVAISGEMAKNLTFTANWKPISSTVSLHANGGTCEIREIQVTYGVDVKLPTPVWEGHRFLGWYQDGEIVLSGTWRQASDSTLEARWESEQYTITYEGMANAVNPAENLRVYTYEDSFTLQDPTRTGYDFLGWTYDGQTTPVKNVQITVGEIGAKTITANWKAKTTVITLCADGCGEDGTQISVTYDSTYSLPVPTRTGYSFTGWSDDGSVVSNQGTWSKLAESLTLTANWKINTYQITLQNVREYNNTLTITLNENYEGGTTTPIACKRGEPLRYVTPSERIGYVFAGWFTTDSCASGTEFDFTSTLSTDITLYAKWIEAVAYCDGSIFLNSTVDNIEFTVGKEALFAFVSPISQFVTIYTTHQEGDPYLMFYDCDMNPLDGLHDDDHGNSDAEITWMVEAGQVYYVGLGGYMSGIGSLHLTADQVIDGGSTGIGGQEGFWYENGSNETIAVQHGDLLVLPTPQRSGYTFTGWYVNGELIQSGNPWMLGSDAVLQAQWQ